MKPYPRYNQSSARWYSSFPENWSEVKAKRLFSNERERASSEDEQLAASQKYGVIPQALMMAQNNAKVMLALKGTDNFKQVKENDFVISLRSFEGGIEHSKYNGCISPAYTVLRLQHESSYPNYFRYALKCSPFIQALNSTSEGIRDGKTITYDEFGELLVVLPSQAEQKTIAKFLDRETQRIDSLIGEKQNFIKLLKEKRQALISHVVTKGLNPDVDMQDSGIEWIGQVPKHWVCPNYRYVCEIYRGKFTHRPRNDPAMFDGIHPFIQTGDVARAKNILSSYSQTLSDAGTEVSQLIPKGTLMMVITGAKIGSTAILGFDSYAPDSVVGFKAKPTIELSYLKYSLMAALPALEQTSIQSTQPNLNIDRIGSLKTPLPPLDEQVSIVNYIENQLSNFETVLSAVEDSIKLLLERRTSLISAAVTGEIDVREAV
ncbi:restriction endonuclease subunit S [Vibrio artabrorum]|uniref:restriction endonuclease subunit S n=1 Tax=Vibrio artabrorum TaxID=446374 RepID=UPI00354F427C